VSHELHPIETETDVEDRILLVRLRNMLQVAEAEEAILVANGDPGGDLDQLREAMTNARREADRLDAKLAGTSTRRSSTESGSP